MRRRPPRARPSGARLAALLLLATLLAGCASSAPGSAGAGAGAGALSVQGAERVLAAVMATNNRANASLDTKLLASYETGSAFAIDAAQYQASRLAHASDSLPFGVVPLQTVVSGSGTPERFLVVGRTVLSRRVPKSQLGACPNDDTLLLFEHSAPGDRWRIALEPSADAGRFAELAASRDGTASVVPAALEKATDELPGRVAAALVRFEASGRLGSLRPSDFNGACWAVPNPRLAVQQAEQAGFDARELFAPVGPSVTFALADGGGLALFALRFVETIVAPVSSAIAWHHDSQVITSSLLPAGRYSRVTETGEVEIAALVGSSGTYGLAGAYSGTTSITGTKAKAPLSGGPGTLLSAGG